MKKILVVDDDEMLCRFACDILSMEGYRAVPAVSSTEALAAFDREDFDLLVQEVLQLGRELAQEALRELEAPSYPALISQSRG